MSSTPDKPSRQVAQSTPIDHLPTELSRAFTHVHPVLILSAYRYCFAALVADPVSALLRSLLPLSILQISYVVACLPAARRRGSLAPSSSSGGKASQRKRHEGLKVDIQLSKQGVSATLCVLLALLLGAPFITVLMILLGAPLTTHLPHTILAAAHLSLLSLTPLLYVWGLERSSWRNIVSLMVPLDEVFGASLGTFVGAWLGAIPIPLDWDREWQKWPITIVTGAYAGYVVGKYLGSYPLKRKKINFD